MTTVSSAAEKRQVLMVDDHAMFCQAMAGLFAGVPDVSVAAHSGSIEGALEMLRSRKIDLVLLDVDLGQHRGSEFLTRARQQGYSGPVLILTAGAAVREWQVLAGLGAAGMVGKDVSFEALLEKVREAMSGRLPGVEPTAVALRPRLTERERDVLRAVFEGLSNKEIATRLQVSETAVKATLQQLFGKAGVHTRGQLVRIALERYSDQL